MRSVTGRPWALPPWLALCFVSLGACKGGELDAPLPSSPPSPAPTSSTPIALPPDVGDPPLTQAPEACDPVSLDHPETFGSCSRGSGVFGAWTVDAYGLPAYDYGLDEGADPRAAFANSEKLDRRDHWAPVGNGRVTALVYNDGMVEVTTQDRGPSYLNKRDDEQGWFSGGFSYLDDGERTWATAYKWRPDGATTRRRFGAAYAEQTTTYRGVRVTRRLVGDPGGGPYVVVDVVLENVAKVARSLRHYEAWDVAHRAIQTNWIVSGAIPNIPATVRKERDQRNDRFRETSVWDAGSRVLGVRRSHAPGVDVVPLDQESALDDWPGDPFLAAIAGGDVAGTYTDQARFLGAGGVLAPDAVTQRLSGDAAGNDDASALGQPKMLAIRTDVSLAPGETRALRFAYGYAGLGEPYAIDAGLADTKRDLAAERSLALKATLPLFAPSRDPVLHREMAWHQAMLEATVARRDYWGRTVVPQGSAYLWLHGADGVPRDYSLFSIPLVYTHPELAREELLMNMQAAYASDHTLAYSFQGHGVLDDALGLHAHPSDLDIFLLFAVSEYVGATGDTSILEADVSYTPKSASATGWEHVREAATHLLDVVGSGPHGLVRVTSGDWSDGIVIEAKNRDLAIAMGESVPNTQMAAAVLPRAAELLQAYDSALATKLRDQAKAWGVAAQTAWTGSFYGRAYFGDGVLVHTDAIDLEAQVWALIGGVMPSGDRDTLVARIASDLDDPCAFGATLRPGGQVWPAISGLLTWGYARSDGERAWRHLSRNTMAEHAVAFPSLWYGIWSGPDGMLCAGPHAGEAWSSQVTPMTDFPLMNANQHAMPLLAMLRVAGLEATAAGLRVGPRGPADFALRTRLVDLDVRGGAISGAYRPAFASSLTIAAPPGHALTSASVAGATIPLAAGSTEVTVSVAAGGATFAVEISP